VVLAAAVSCSAQKAPPPAAAPESPVPHYLSDPAAIQRGRLIFIGSCGGYCHDLHGAERAAPSLFDCTWKHGGSDDEIFHTISEGVPGTQMPPWKNGLPGGADDIWKVIAYLRSASTCATNPAAAH
jgi:mono/diheme cytochrome c family protein